MDNNKHFDDNRAEILEKGVANKILEQLNRLKMNSTEESSRRWIWELIQNAKDVVNENGNVNIHILYDKKNKKLCFQHNGDLFTDKSILYLIEQVSSKEQKNIEGGVTGKFGTGFLTTHLLSEKAEVAGILIDQKDNELKSFSLCLDRTGYSASEIIQANHLSTSQLKQNLKVINRNEFEQNEFNTSFKYNLDSNGIIVAEDGLRDFYHAIAYVFAFVPQLNNISINNDTWQFNRLSESVIDNEIRQTVIQQVIKGEVTTRSIVSYSRDDIDIALEIDGENQPKIMEYHETLPKLFCDFPLVGTSDFPIPFIVNSHLFNPTEPRDGIFLKSNEYPDAIENKNLLMKAIVLYRELLEIISVGNWKQVYHITKVTSIPNKTWIPDNWVEENVVNPVKKTILEAEIVDPFLGDRCAFYDCLDSPKVYIINDTEKEVREEIWQLIKWQMPEKITKQTEIHDWYHSLWKKCRNYSLNDLISWVAGQKNITSLIEASSSGFNFYSWINKLYTLIENDHHLFMKIYDENIEIFPNQEGKFCSINELFVDQISDEIYKEILEDAGYGCRHKLLDSGIFIKFKMKPYGNTEIFNEIDEALSENLAIKLEVFKKIVRLHIENFVPDDEQIALLSLLEDLGELPAPELIPVKEFSKELSEKSKKEICKHIVFKVAECKSLETLQHEISKSAKEWIVKLIDFLNKFDHENLLELKNHPILPNQLGYFLPKEELFLDDGQIDEILKDIAKEERYDIRSELLMIEVYLDLPETRTRSILDITQYVTNYVKRCQTNKVTDDKVKDNFRSLFLWITDNEEKAKLYFGELYTNKHWLYDDNEIATNIRKAEEYDSLLNEYKISNKEELEIILRNYRKDETYEITKELLVQAGIFNEDKLQMAVDNNVFGNHFKHDSDHDNSEKYQYAMNLQERATKRIFKYLASCDDYDVNEPIQIDKTVYIIRKHNEEIYLIIRPSDYDKVILYYNTEYDVLDFEKDWELWVEDESRSPERITFGKMLKFTGINQIPLRKVVFR